MKCFYNPAADAVGTCKSCGKGLCAEHAVDLGKGLACKDRCEADVRALIALIEGNIAMSATSQKLIAGSGRSGIVTSIFFLLMGATFVVVGILITDRRGSYPAIFGALLIAWSLYTFFRSYAIHRTATTALQPKP